MHLTEKLPQHIISKLWVKQREYKKEADSKPPSEKSLRIYINPNSMVLGLYMFFEG